MKTLQDLNIEYWCRVHDMCKGTRIEGREWECVKLSDREFSSKFYTHPDFNQSGKWEFAIAVLEGKPVFLRDRVYFKLDRSVYIIDENTVSSNIEKFFTWGHHPAKKRTFMLNGAELYCPRKISAKHSNVLSIKLCDSERHFDFESLSNANELFMTLTKILTEARDKE